VITPNRSELRAIIGRWKDEEDLQQSVSNLIAHLELEAILLTRSEEGMTLFDQQGRIDVPALAREVFDVSGAGDTVIAVLAMVLASGKTLREAVPLANKAAGIVVGKLGTAVCSREELFT
jgi:rfaE bifunctional protein kinase chain/domain